MITKAPLVDGTHEQRPREARWVERLVRLFHVHDWHYMAPKHFAVPNAEELCIESAPATRKCAKCGKTQYRERHCLGLNPPEYVVCWYDLRPEPECFRSNPGPQSRAENDCGSCGHRGPCLANTKVSRAENAPTQPL